MSTRTTKNTTARADGADRRARSDRPDARALSAFPAEPGLDLPSLARHQAERLGIAQPACGMDDLRQEAWLAICRARQKWDPDRGPFGAFCVLMTFHHLYELGARDARRRRVLRRRSLLDGEEHLDTTAEDPAGVAEHAEICRLLLAAVRGLPPVLRRATVEHYLQGRSVEQIAADEGVTYRQIYRRLTQARALLREMLPADEAC